MKIDPVTTPPVERTQSTTKSSGDFAALLAAHCQEKRPQAPALSPAVLGVQAALVQETERTVMEHIATLMKSWDDYATSIAQADLKHGHAILGAIQQQLATVKEALGKIPDVHPKLQAMVEEMDVLGAAEEIKFNRGDYL